MKVRYTKVFAIGGSSHMVELYPEYSKEQGLMGEGKCFRSSRKDDILKVIKGEITPDQKKRLNSMMSHGTDGIVDEEGTYYSN